MEHYLDVFMQHAELKITEFDIHRRTELRNMKRTRSDYIMSYHKQGNASLRIADQTYQITPGTVIMIPPNVEHDHFKDSVDETIFLWWHFKFEIVNVIDVLRLFQFPTTFQLQNSREFEEIFMQFIESTKKPAYLPTTILKRAKSLELLYLLLESAMEMEYTSIKDVHSANFIELLTRIIQYPEQSVSLKDLSKELHMHPTYISNRFKDLFGRSPIQIHREIRMEKAKMLLTTSELSITEISNLLGFTGLHSFTRLFKSRVGISPSQFRSLNKRMNIN